MAKATKKRAVKSVKTLKTLKVSNLLEAVAHTDHAMTQATTHSRGTRDLCEGISACPVSKGCIDSRPLD